MLASNVSKLHFGAVISRSLLVCVSVMVMGWGEAGSRRSGVGWGVD